MQRSRRNIAYSMGRWSGRHPWRAIGGWLAFVALALFLGGALGTKQLDQADLGIGESGKATKVLDEAGFNDEVPATESVLIQSKSGSLDTRTLAVVSGDVAARLGKSADVTNIQLPTAPGNEALISKDGRSALVQFDIKGPADVASDKVEPLLATVAAAQKAHPDVLVEEYGIASVSKGIDDAIASDFQKAEKLSIPITLVILLVAFGALLAAGIPVLLGLSSVFASIGLLGVASQITPVSQNASVVMMLLGMAVGVDYSLFYLKREREERAAGRGAQAALEAAAATSGRAVLISGFTVMAAQAGLFFSGEADSISMAIGSILVVGVAVLGSLTVLPAVLAKLGHRVHKSRIPLLSRLRRDGDSRFWGAILTRVLRRPLVSLALGTAVLVGLTIPAFNMQTKTTGIEDLPRSIPGMTAYDHVEAAFPSESLITADVVIKADDVRDPQVAGAIERLKAEAVKTGQVKEPIGVDISPDHTVANVALPIVGDGTNAASTGALETIRERVVPATVGQVRGAETHVGGMTASTVDFNANQRSHAPYVFGFVIVIAFVLLLMSFRSVVIPVKAIVLNLLSVGASLGLLTLIFQHGYGVELLGAEQGGIVSWLPMFLFVLLFGLSMDYHVFILSRIKELYDNGASNDEAVERGIKSSAGVVTAAATVMVAVFSIFATLSLVDFKQFGVGLAFAVLLDATLIRGVVLPASMKLLGNANWWMPKSLGWVPTLDHGGLQEAPAAS